VGRLDTFQPNTVVTPQILAEAGIIKSPRTPVKVLGEGSITYPLVVKADKFSATARRKIEAAGGRIDVSKAG
jgi:large subunit ribosomal protein L15